jgi:general secretion pathway protein E
VTIANLQQLLTSASPSDPQAAVTLVDALLAASAAAGASDLHLLPTADGLAVSWRIDGVLQPVGRVPQELASNIITRLKVLARLLTYRTHVPQEGRIAAEPGSLEVRISTFPTLFGEKIVARNLPRGEQPLARIADLGLPEEVSQTLRDALRQTSGAIIIAGPAGSGKTTTAYSCLREIAEASRGQRSIASLEDPVEVAVEGVAQSQVADAAGFDLLTGLRSLVRQDPEVIFIGEIRDAEAAAVALQAALTGQLLVTTFHATDAAVALSRLREMGLPPYAIRSAVHSVVAQRLVRRLCSCAAPVDEQAAGAAAAALNLNQMNLPATGILRPVGCEACRQTGYAGRLAVAEVLNLQSPRVAEAILANSDAAALRTAATSAGMASLFTRAAALVSRGQTSVEEVLRVFGIAPQTASSAAD